MKQKCLCGFECDDLREFLDHPCELESLDITYEEAKQMSKEIYPINSVSDAIEVLYWAITDNNREKMIRAYDALCRLTRNNTGGARRIK